MKYEYSEEQCRLVLECRVQELMREAIIKATKFNHNGERLTTNQILDEMKSYCEYFRDQEVENG